MIHTVSSVFVIIRYINTCTTQLRVLIIASITIYDIRYGRLTLGPGQAGATEPPPPARRGASEGLSKG